MWEIIDTIFSFLAVEMYGAYIELLLTITPHDFNQIIACN